MNRKFSCSTCRSWFVATAASTEGIYAEFTRRRWIAIAASIDRANNVRNQLHLFCNDCVAKIAGAITTHALGQQTLPAALILTRRKR